MILQMPNSDYPASAVQIAMTSNEHPPVLKHQPMAELPASVMTAVSVYANVELFAALKQLRGSMQSALEAAEADRGNKELYTELCLQTCICVRLWVCWLHAQSIPRHCVS